MSLPSQPLSSEEPEQQPTLPSTEETPTELAPISDFHSQETEQQPTLPVSEDLPSATEASPETHEHEPSPLNKEETLLPDNSETFVSGQGETPLLDKDETSPPSEGESEPDDEKSELDDEEEVESEQTGVFIRRGWLIAATCAVVVAALLLTLFLVVTHPQDPPADWIASYIPPAGASGPAKILYYLHWSNENGNLKGQLQLAANSNGTPQSLTVPVVGLYNKENRIIYVVITVNGQPDTLTGTVNEKNDTLTLNQVNSTDEESKLVFHTGNANDYKQATKKLSSGAK